ncbi:MAG: hypothetical protein GTN49_09655 [candidate division Zixibacteria bacterium]|nr:hypothetical protein [candidate division Zixibacteria bacterium]
MKSKYLWWALVLAIAAMLVAFGCKGRAGKETGEFEEITVEEVTAPPEEAEEGIIPEQPVYHPTKADNLKMLDDVLGAAEDTLGWDNVFCSITLGKGVDLFEELQPAYTPGTHNRTFINDAITDLGNIKTWVEEKIDKSEGVDPASVDAKGKKKQIRTIRATVKGIISGPAPTQEPIPEWKGDLIKKKLHEHGEMLKRKWAERDKR